MVFEEVLAPSGTIERISAQNAQTKGTEKSDPTIARDKTANGRRPKNLGAATSKVN